MKKKVFSLMMMLLLAVTGFVRAEELTVYEWDGNTSTDLSNMPAFVSYFDDFTRAQHVIPAADLAAMNGTDIQSLKWYTRDYNLPYTTVSTVDVYVKEVNETTISAFVAKADCQMVYQGTLEFVQVDDHGECTVTFTTPYHYNGGNLLIGVENTTDAGYKFIYFHGITVQGASISGHNSSSLDGVTPSQRNFIPQTTFTYGEGGDEPVNPDEPGYTDGLHVLSADGTIDTVNVGSRPLNAWMAPYVFKMYNESNEDYTVTVLDFTPNDGVFENLTEVPYELAAGDTTDITIDVHPTEAGVINRQFVAIYEGTRLAHIWPITAEAYTPICPDVVEVAYELNDGEPIEPGFTWKEFMSTIWAGEDEMELHNDYTLPYPEIPEGKDAVMKFTLDKAMMLSAKVSTGENGKVALYTEDFYGEEGPMATNNYTERPMNGGGSGSNTTIDFETGDFSQFNNYTNDSNYPWVVTADAAYTGSFGMKSGNAGVASSTSAFTATVNYTRDGSISFDYGAWGEGSSSYWDHCDFYIDGTRVIYEGATQAWNQFSQEITAGEHVFKWSYTKDSSVNPTVDCFKVDNIVFDGGRMRTDASELALNESFETATPNDLPEGWTMIDADGDGYNWYTLNWIEAGWEESGAHTGDQWATSASYFGEALNPDNYLVSPQVTLGGTLTFWACAQDESWAAEKFGVAVSTTGNTNASDFTTVQSWTMSAKGVGAKTSDTRGGNRQGAWYQYTVDLSNYAGQTGYVAIRHYDCSNWFRLNVDDIQLTAVGGNEPEEPVVAGVGPEIDSLNVVAGTYYLVASSTDDDFEVEINIDELPCPFEGVTQIYPEDNAEGIEPNSVTLRWKLNPYCTEYRLVFSSTYWPDDEPNNPFTIITDWSSDLAESYTVTDLFNNTNYFWRIDQRSNGGEEEGGCTVTGEVFGFTTHFNKPQNLVATPDEIFEGQTVTLTWNAVVDRTYRMYRIYKDGELIGTTDMNQINATSFPVPASELTYNMEGYIFNVTAVYDEGESDFSNDAEVKVSGYSNETGINGYAYEQDGETPIEGVTVTITGTDEFGDEHVYTATTDENGYYHVQVYVGNYTMAVANKEGYQTTVTNHELPFDVALNGQVNDVNFIMDENFVAPAHVCAELVEVDGEELVKVWWDFDFYNALIEDFETGDLSSFDWVNSTSYPWTVVTTNPYEGTYCLKSGGAGVASVVSDLSVTVDVPNDGKISFFVKPSCESSWDNGYFYIDGTQKGSFTGAGSWAEKKYDITAGEHTFKWQYTKDGSINANDDCIYVDYIQFNVLPDPPVVGNDYNFDNGLQGWTNIDADGDGYIWVSSADPGAYHNAGVDLTGLGHNDSEAFVISGSYSNASGMALHPDNYLVSPQVQLGGMVKFYAQAQDVSYAAEHFGVAVSTTSNTDASAFTTIQEWTMTAKNAGPKSGVRAVRAGEWYEYTVDLSAYSGMGYVAIRHFNCTDQFILNVDDITIGDPAKGGDRALNHYNIYRTDCYNDGPYNDTTTLFLATVWRPDTAYFDVSWPDAAPGVYKWGVSSVYAGNRVVDYPAEPRESDIVWSNMCSPCIDKDMTIDSLVTVNVLLNSADSPEGTVVTFTNLNEGEQAAHPMDPITLDATGFYRFPSFRKGDYTVTVEHNGYETITDTPVSIWEPVDLRYVMIEILYGIDNLYVSRTGWAMWDAQGDAPTPEPTPDPTPDPEGNVTVVLTADDVWSDGSGYQMLLDADANAFGTTIPETGALSMNCSGNEAIYAEFEYKIPTNADGNCSTSNMVCNSSVSITIPAGTYDWCITNPTPNDRIWIASSNGTIGGRYDDYTFEAGNTYTFHVYLGGSYDGVDLTVTPGAKSFQKMSLSNEGCKTVDDVIAENIERAGRHLEYFKVMCTSIDGEPIFNANTEHPFCQLATDELVEGEQYICKVAAVYSTGQGPWSEVVWQYESCENYAGTVDGVTVDGNTISWTYPDGGDGPTPPPTTGEWYYYDNGTNVDAIGTGGGNFWWGVMFPAGSYTGNQVTKIAAYGYMPMTGTATIYQGGTSAPGTAVGQVDVTLAGNSNPGEGVFHEFEFASPVVIDPTQNVWVVLYNASGAGHPAAACNNTGDPNGRWVSLDGTVWEDIAGYGLDYTFMVRAYIAGGAKGEVEVLSYEPETISNPGTLSCANGGNHTSNRAEWTFANGFVTDPGAMANGADASWIKGSQATWGPGCQQANGNRCADSFTLEAATTIDEITVYGYQTGSSTTSTFTGLYAQIYNGNPMSGGTVVWGDATANIMTSTAFTNCYRGSDGETTATTRPIMGVTASGLNISLEAGTYYLVYSLDGTGSSGPWAVPHAEPGVGNTGNGVQYVSTGWQTMLDGGTSAPYGCAMSLHGTTGSGPAPQPGDTNCIGAMIFVDGEWEAFVPAPINTYTYEGEGENICVRMVYDGTAELPDNNFYYAMSCEECVETTPTCAAGAPIYAESLGETDQVKIWWGEQEPEPQPGEGDTFTVDFESGLPAGWTTIDADGDGNNWEDLGMEGHSGACISSQSYINYVGPLTPDNYLVSPAVTLGAGSTFSFWACAQDASYAAEHFGVAVSDDGVNFTTIQEWTIGAKEEVKGAVRSGRDQSAWTQYTVDLSNYAGEGRYIAIRHFNCTDQFYLNVDDIELANAAKNRDGIVKYNVYRSADNATYELIAEVPAVEGQTYYEYIDTPATGTYYYQVRADYGECESEPAVSGVNPDVNYVTAEVTGIDELNNVALYPNPTNSNVTIEAAGMRHITVVSVLGQVVYDAEVDNDQVILNMSQYNAGVYVVRVATANGVSTHRVTVVR